MLFLKEKPHTYLIFKKLKNKENFKLKNVNL